MLSSCGDDKPTVIVDVISGIVPDAQFVFVESAIYAGSLASETGATRRDDARMTARRDQDFAHGLRVASFEGVDPGTYTIEVQLLKADRRLVLRRRVVINVQDNTVVRVHMTPNCVGVSCPSPGGGAGFSECIDGHCVDPRCNPPSMEFCDGLTFCASAAACGPYAPCAEAVCIDGICDAAPEAGVCEDPLYCNPLSSESPGCEPYPSVDAGMPMDASEVDAGVDAEVVDAAVDAPLDMGSRCGLICTSESNPCLWGTVDCASGAEVCDATFERVGASCGDNQVCGVGGACVACEEGAECNVGCVLGHLSCGGGAPRCVENSPITTLPLGTVCDAQCPGGTICPGLHTCNADSLCMSCDDGAACTAGCFEGRIDCMRGGECVSTGVQLPTFSTCGTSDVCNEHGVCVECIEGMACQTESECASGVVQGCGAWWINCAVAEYKDPGDACYDTGDGVCSGDGRCYEPMRATHIAASTATGCAVQTDGTLLCWGYDLVSRDDSTYLTARFAFPGFDDVVQVAFASNSPCARTSAGEVYCTGSNYWGEVGDGTYESRYTPVRVSLPAPAVDIAGAESIRCAALTNGELYCWGLFGRDYTGEFQEVHNAPTLIAGVVGATRVAIATGGGYGTVCAVQSDGLVKCFGNNFGGMLGDGAPFDPDYYANHYQATVATVAGIDDAVSIDLGYGGGSACVLRASGQVWCWGSGDIYTAPRLGALGSASIAYSPVPVRADLVTYDDVLSIESYASARCLLRGNGEVYCFGVSSSELGRDNDSIALPSWMPAPIAGIHDAIELADGAPCVLRAGGEIACWGDYFTSAAAAGLGDHGVPRPVHVMAVVP